MKELIEAVDYYNTVDGLFVFTDKYLRERGYCCGFGCRHCPYQYDGVPEPKKSLLLNESKKEKNGEAPSIKSFREKG